MRKFLGLTLLLAAACLAARVQAQQPIRVNCGGPSYTDTKGNVWQADSDFNGGSVVQIPAHVAGTSDPALFQDARRNNGTSPLEYSFPVANGKYHVNLYFAETATNGLMAGARVFNVKMEGTLVFSDVDIFAEAGANAVLEKGADVAVSNGSLLIELDDIKGDAKVSAIEILPGASGPLLTLNFKYPDGTPVIGSLAYTVTSSLVNLNGTQPLTNGSAQAALFANPSALGISADFNVKLSLNDNSGHTLWQVNLEMNPATVNLAAVQSSAMNVVVEKM